MANNIFQPEKIQEATKLWDELTKQVSDSVKVLVDYRAEAQKLPSTYITNLNKIKDSQNALNDSINKTKTAQTQLTAEQKESERQDKRNTTLKAKLNQATSQQAKENNILNEQLKQVNREQRNAAKTTITFRDAYDKLNNELREAERNYKNLAASQGLSNSQTIKAQKEVQRLRKRVDGINKPIKRFGDNVGNYPKQISPAISALKGFIGAFGIIEGLRFGASFTLEAAELARQAKGVEFAFERLGVTGEQAFDKIKRSTRGVLSDLEIKRSLNEFDNFNISLEQTDVLFEFLAVRAAQTGKSVDSLRDSLVEGLSKESKLRIDNLGISMAELNAELEKAPDFVTAVANIAKTEIAEAGNILDEATSSQDKFNAALENFKVSAGSGFIGEFIADINDLGTSFINLTSDINDASDGFIDFLVNVAKSTTIAGEAQVRAEAIARRDLKQRTVLVDRIIQQQRERGLTEQQLINNRESLLRLGKTQLQNILKDTEATERNNQAKKEGNKIRQKEVLLLKDIHDELVRQQEAIKNVDKAVRDYVGGIEEIDLEPLEVPIEFNPPILSDDELDILNEQLQGLGRLYDIDARKFTKLFDDKKNTVNDYVDAAGEAVTGLYNLFQTNYDTDLMSARDNAERALMFVESGSEAEAEIKRQLAEKEEEIRAKQLQQEKDAALFNIFINTARGITAALTSTPPNIPLSIVVGAIGAAQAASVASREIPQFKDGVRNFEGGLAIVGDGGKSEVIGTDKGYFKTPSKDTLVNLPKGADVYSSENEFKKELGFMLNSNGILPERPFLPMIKVENNGLSKQDFNKGVRNLERAINRSNKQPNVTVNLKSEERFSRRITSQGKKV